MLYPSAARPDHQALCLFRESIVIPGVDPVRPPAGTAGTVVSDYGDVVLVEVSSESGNAMGFVQVPVAKLELKR